MTTTPSPAAVVHTLRAHAKLTLSLRMTGVRPDGFHLIDAEMVSLELHDLLTFDATRSGLAGTGPFSAGMPTDTSNLVARALRLGGADAHVTVDKQIPHGGGLGGGSSDAATALRWAGFGTTAEHLAVAATLGADIPFCLVGGRARVRGIGEVVDPLPHLDRAITLVIPPLTVGTPAAYRAWDDLPEADQHDDAAQPNDLTAAALVVEPRLAWWRDAIGDRSGATPVLAGSGATWFVDGEREDALADLIDEGATVVSTRTVPSEVATAGR